MTPGRTELVVCANWRQARHAGFDERGRHRQDPQIVAWWPELPKDLLYRGRFERVTVTDDFSRYRFTRVHEELMGLIRSRAAVNAIWMDL